MLLTLLHFEFESAALSNPSVKVSTNGRPGYSRLLFLPPPGPPLAPPYLER